MVWGQRWFVVILPILSLISATGKVFDLVFSLRISNLLFSVENH